jgi:hypothetical protein
LSHTFITDKISIDESYHLGFVMGKAKLAPQAGHSIPRLELCGAVLATEIGQFVAKQLDILPSVYSKMNGG